MSFFETKYKVSELESCAETIKIMDTDAEGRLFLKRIPIADVYKMSMFYEKNADRISSMEELIGIMISRNLEVERMWINESEETGKTISCRMKSNTGQLYGFYIPLDDYINSSERDALVLDAIGKVKWN